MAAVVGPPSKTVTRYAALTAILFILVSFVVTWLAASMPPSSTLYIIVMGYTIAGMIVGLVLFLVYTKLVRILTCVHFFMLGIVDIAGSMTFAGGGDMATALTLVLLAIVNFTLAVFALTSITWVEYRLQRLKTILTRRYA